MTPADVFPAGNKKGRVAMECNIAILCFEQLDHFTAVLLDQFRFVPEIFCSDRLIWTWPRN